MAAVMLLVAGMTLLLSILWIVAHFYCKRLPATNARIVDFKLTDHRTSTTQMLRVEVVYESSAGKHKLLVFPFAARDEAEVRASQRYSELQRLFTVGQTTKLHYIPGLRWMGVFPEVDTLGTDLAFALLAGFVSALIAATAILALQQN